jgi:predicted transcriptional regulator
MKQPRSGIYIILDVLLICRLPAAPSHIMSGANSQWYNIHKYINFAIDKGLLEQREKPVYISSSTRKDRRRRGWDEYRIYTTPIRTCVKWYKTTYKGEKFIRLLKQLWEIHGKSSIYKGELSFDSTGKRIGRTCPITLRDPDFGFDREWAITPSNSIMHVEMQERQRDVKISIL